MTVRRLATSTPKPAPFSSVGCIQFGHFASEIGEVDPAELGLTQPRINLGQTQQRVEHGDDAIDVGDRPLNFVVSGQTTHGDHLNGGINQSRNHQGQQPVHSAPAA